MYYRPSYSWLGACQPPYGEMHIANKLPAVAIILLQRATRTMLWEQNKVQSHPAVNYIWEVEENVTKWLQTMGAACSFECFILQCLFVVLMLLKAVELLRKGEKKGGRK